MMAPSYEGKKADNVMDRNSHDGVFSAGFDPLGRID